MEGPGINPNPDRLSNQLHTSNNLILSLSYFWKRVQLDHIHRLILGLSLFHDLPTYAWSKMAKVKYFIGSGPAGCGIETWIRFSATDVSRAEQL